MKLSCSLLAGLLFCSCGNSHPSEPATPSADTIAASNRLRQESLSTPALGQRVSDDMLSDMRSMMAGIKALHLTGDPDIDYAMIMKLHHESAIRMAQRELNAGADKKLKATAAQMIQQQQEEADKFQAFVDTHKPGKQSSFGQDIMRFVQDTTLENLPMKSDPDQDFAALMVRHHKDAIAITNEALKTLQEHSIIQLAQKIAVRLKNEIAQLNAWTATHASKGS